MKTQDTKASDAEVIKRLRKELYEAHYYRSSTIWFLFDELRKEFGLERTRKALKKGFYRLGEQMGQQMFDGKNDVTVDTAKALFENGGGDEGRIFSIRYICAKRDALDVQAMTCPLKDGLVKMGLPVEEVATVCEIADTMTCGLIEAGGLEYSSETWQPGDPPGCCIMHIRPGKDKEA